MGSLWRKAKSALGFNLTVDGPTSSAEDDDDGDCDGGSRTGEAAAGGGRASGAAFSEASSPGGSVRMLKTPMPTPTPSSSSRWLFRSGSRSSKKTCTICLGAMKAGPGHALFTAECSHTFHFHCITSNVKYGNYICPICRAKWKEIPFRAPVSSEHSHGSERANLVNQSQEDVHMLPRADLTNQQHRRFSCLHASEPHTFNDDEPLNVQSETAETAQQGCTRTVEIKLYPEFSSIPQSASQENFTVLIHLEAPRACRNQNVGSATSQTSRAPVDLITVIDVSGSMAGTKLALLKRAMSFVIQNLGPLDRLSVIAFSSTARRLFHLQRMTDTGRQQALQAVNSLISCGGTNIAEGLWKGAKVIKERTEQNPVCSMILLSDGQDTYTLTSSLSRSFQSHPDYRSLVPSSILGDIAQQIPVHAFGFGADHDSTVMHSISEISGGTFSFIESEVEIQDAFAQCIGGLLSVVVKEMLVVAESGHPGVQLAAVKSGNYTNKLADDARSASITVGDLYADEDRNFLVSVNVPPSSGSHDMVLLKVCCAYRDVICNESITLEDVVRIQRPEVTTAYTSSVDVDRERNRVQAAEAMLKARAAAERGVFSEAVSILEDQRRKLFESLAGQSGDQLCLALDAELREMQERMATQQRYEVSGRAYLLSGLSSHSWQRATARGDSTDLTSLVHAYQTPSMVEMLHRSQTFSPSPRTPTPPAQPARSFSFLGPQPR
ncbi:unnamed protein product [Musa acuminata subsp. malaccensis]|uniref:(wild Malaysian banana) hypothetical protein n=1 Tax=Musa acuminata subsp. malaccensis TaxID=214687 RepID=A0A804ISY2_MUSAM|nr:PREDICTED: uncharacterized protein LOC103976539 [Musa acuminata subsp. malaccensis]CAG1843135.1 unnamed protein product [Musa acuminata subsp. malaccensis]